MSSLPITLPIRTPSLYENLKVESTQIRLLEIVSTSPEIVCKLNVSPLLDCPPFSALSYVWGDAKEKKRITVNGKPVDVTVELVSALEYAPGHMEKSKVAARLWVDALCINQEDLEEKNHQVPLMKDIYSQAEMVICWLGAPDKSTHSAMHWIKVVAKERPPAVSGDEDESHLPILGKLGSIHKESLMVVATCTEILQLWMANEFQLDEEWVGAVRQLDLTSLFLMLEEASELLDDAKSQGDGIATSVKPWLLMLENLMPEFQVTYHALDANQDLLEMVLSTYSHPELEAMRDQKRDEIERLVRIMVRFEDDIPEVHRLLFLASYLRNLSWISNHPEFLEPQGSEKQCGLEDALYVFDLPYWLRVWIFQETVLARKPVFACGNESVSLSSVWSFYRWTRSFGSRPTPPRPGFFPAHLWDIMTDTNVYGFTRIQHVFDAREKLLNATGTASGTDNSGRDGSEDAPGWNQWNVSAISNSTNPKDHFYGFLGISGLGLVPDYRPTKSVGQVCGEFLAESVKEYRRNKGDEYFSSELHHLHSAGIGHGWHMYPETPSWAPNFPGMAWSRQNDTNNAGDSTRGTHPIDLDDQFGQAEKANFVGGKMTVPVMILDTLERTGPLRKDYGDVDACKALQPIAWAIDFATRHQEYVAGCHPLQAIDATLRHEMVDSWVKLPERPSETRVPKTFVKVLRLYFNYAVTVQPETLRNIDRRIVDEGYGFLKALLEHDDETTDPAPGEDEDERPLAYEDTSGEEDASDDEKRKSDDDSSDDETANKHQTKQVETDADMDAIYEAIVDLRKRCMQKIERLAETKLGYVGLFPRDVAAGDLLCIMSGTAFTSVLRKVDGHYCFVGTCFVYGLDNEYPISQLIEKQDARVETVEIW